MSKDDFRETETKVLPIENWLKARQEGEDGLSQLVGHMRQVREAVPVNRRLQSELRKKLLLRQQELQLAGRTVPESAAACPAGEPGKGWRRFTPVLGGVAVFLAVLALVGLWRQTGGQVILEAADSPQEITRFWTESQPLQPAVSPDGSKILVVRGGGMVLLSETGVQLASLEPPEGVYFHSPSWSPDGQRVSFVQGNRGGAEEIRDLAADQLMSEAKASRLNSTMDHASDALQDNRIMKEGTPSTHINNMVFSPDGKKLAYVSTDAGGVARIFIRLQDGTSRLVTEGDYPAWGPDGQHLVVQRPSSDREGYDLYLVNLQTGGADLLGQGETPTWSNNGYLAFTVEKTQERVLTFMPNGEPQYSVRQQASEIRISYLGKDGSPALQRLSRGEGWLASSSLLVEPENRVSGMVINWLRQQETTGDHEPKTLMLNEVNKCEGHVFGPEGKWLLYARRDGDTVALVKLRLEERWEKRRD
ncbi:peptidase S9 [Desulforamulus ruminis]|uniref:TolB family protein n=1 Tax=Desulforamulus ruminis TaxID=1564 RepID=UPI002FD91A52